MCNFVLPLLNVFFELEPKPFVFSRICQEPVDLEGGIFVISYKVKSCIFFC
jgi:hypothetical protein